MDKLTDIGDGRGARGRCAGRGQVDKVESDLAEVGADSAEGDGAARAGALGRREVGVPGVGAVPGDGVVAGQEEEAAHTET